MPRNIIDFTVEAETVMSEIKTIGLKNNVDVSTKQAQFNLLVEHYAKLSKSISASDYEKVTGCKKK